MLGFAIFFQVALSAQNVNSEYDRNSLTILSVHHSDSYDNITEQYLLRNNPGGEKFDATRIVTRTIPANYGRYVKNDEVTASQWQKGKVTAVTDEVSNRPIGREVLAAWFNRSESSGKMDLNLINKRADYNATDQTFNIASSQALGEYLLHGDGIALVDNSYILVVDHSQPEKEYTKDSMTGKTDGVKFSTIAYGYLFKLDFGLLERQKVWDCWILDSDSPEARQQKVAKWNSLPARLSLVKSSYTYSSSSKSFTSNDTDETAAMEASIKGCTKALISEMENSVDAWKVKSTIFKTNPIVSKIGTKEGVSNMDRYEALEYLLDDNGSVSTRRRGMVRATTVANNSTNSRGKSRASQFYQISGGRLEPGMLLKQKKSLDFDLKGLYYGGASAGYGLEFDYMFGMSDAGSVNHIRIGGTYYSYKDAAQNTTTGELYSVSSIDVRIGYGYGLHPFRQLEFVPTAFILANSLDTKLTEDDDESTASYLSKTGWGLEAGADLILTVIYPVKLTVGAYYSARFLGGSIWKTYNDILKDAGHDRNGFTWRAGLVYEF